MHFAVSAVVMQGLLILSAPSPSARMRLILFSAGAMVAIALVVALLLSIDSIRDMFLTRAQTVQSYDVGQGGRFYLQEVALGALLEFPFGMGPLEFARVYGLQQHNVYLQAFLVYGWVGGFAYLVLLAATLFTGWRMLWTQTPWQPYLITAYATLIGVIGEGAIIDTDHWRHFFLLLGMVWGLAAATARFHRDAAAAAS
jgi:O-antigen ligase